MNDHINALVRRMADGEALKFKPFWGHSGSGLGPWILSQWYPAPFSADGNTYQTAEHWMMAQKALLNHQAQAVGSRSGLVVNSAPSYRGYSSCSVGADEFTSPLQRGCWCHRHTPGHAQSGEEPSARSSSAKRSARAPTAPTSS
jgi:hypothetical protein